MPMAIALAKLSLPLTNKKSADINVAVTIGSERMENPCVNT